MTSPLTLLFLLACGGDAVSDLGDSADTGTAVTHDTASDAPAPVPTEISAEVSPYVGTVVRVRWTIDGPGTSQVLWDGGESAVLDNSIGDAEVLLVGLDPDALLSLWVRSQHGDDAVDSEPFEVTTGALPQGLPTLEVDLLAEGADDGWVLGSTQGASPAVFVMDRDGRIVWWHVDDTLYGDFAPTEDGLVFLGSNPAGRTLHTISWWGETVSSVTLKDAHHAFGLHDDGSVSFIATDKRAWDTYDRVAGDAIRHLAVDGDITETWNVWDYLEPVPASNWDSPYYSDAEDWTHANGLDVDPTDETALITLTNVDALALVDLQTGALLEGSELLGGTWATAAGEALDFPHDVHRLDADTLLMTTAVDGETVAAEYAHVDGVWSRTWQHGSIEPVSSSAGGSVDRLASGNTLIGWGRSSAVEEVTADGDVVWHGTFLRGAALGGFEGIDVGPWATR